MFQFVGNPLYLVDLIKSKFPEYVIQVTTFTGSQIHGEILGVDFQSTDFTKVVDVVRNSKDLKRVYIYSNIDPIEEGKHSIINDSNTVIFSRVLSLNSKQFDFIDLFDRTVKIPQSLRITEVR